MWPLQIVRYVHTLLLSRKNIDPSISRFLTSSLPSSRAIANTQRYCVIDLETTGLEPQKDHIISVAWLIVENGRIAMQTAQHHYVHSRLGVGQSATIHQIRDCDLDVAMPLGQVLTGLLEDCKDCVLVFHNASLDKRFLDKACRAYFGIPLLRPVIDTLWLERQWFMQRNLVIKSGILRLASCRRRYGLPDYDAHNALVDALATAELLLAMIAKRNRTTCRLDSLLFNTFF